MELGAVDIISGKEAEIDGSIRNFILFINIITFELLGVCHMIFYLVDNPLTFTLKVAVLDLKYIGRLTSSERSEIRVF